MSAKLSYEIPIPTPPKSRINTNGLIKRIEYGNMIHKLKTENVSPRFY